MDNEFFPERPLVDPRIYAYELPDVTTHKGLIKVGYTVRKSVDRIHEQLGTANIKPNILLDESAIRDNGTYFTDHDVHRVLRKSGSINIEKEWFHASLKDVKAAILAVKRGDENVENRTETFTMRPEQKEAVDRTALY